MSQVLRAARTQQSTDQFSAGILPVGELDYGFYRCSSAFNDKLELAESERKFKFFMSNKFKDLLYRAGMLTVVERKGEETCVREL